MGLNWFDVVDLEMKILKTNATLITYITTIVLCGKIDWSQLAISHCCVSTFLFCWNCRQCINIKLKVKIFVSFFTFKIIDENPWNLQNPSILMSFKMFRLPFYLVPRNVIQRKLFIPLFYFQVRQFRYKRMKSFQKIKFFVCMLTHFLIFFL